LPTQREAVRAGALTFAGLGLPMLYGARAQPASSGSQPGFGAAKACIFPYMWGGPSHLDTWDPKPDAPEIVRGPFRPIATNVPGICISEHFPGLARQAHRYAIIRSMSHDDPAHLSTAHWTLTGHLAPRTKSDAIGPSPNDWPHLGSLVAKIHPPKGAMPKAVTMPWTVSHPAAPGGKAPGQHGGWLGKVFDPFRIDGDPNRPGFHVDGLGLPEGMSLARLRTRRSLLGGNNPSEWTGEAAQAWEGNQARALDALVSAEACGAFQVEREDPRTRDRYGRNTHGQCVLLARRLIEAGVELVTVNWHEDGHFFWDTHGDNFNQLKNRLMPPADQAFSALLEDLAQRGRLDDTLVVWVGEFGRSPRITNGSGREHWPRCYSAVLAGAGIHGGSVFGASDRWGAYPARNPVAPDDLAATILYALGIDPAAEVRDPVGRPMRINLGAPLIGLFG
jgi:hypothetical protein